MLDNEAGVSVRLSALTIPHQLSLVDSYIALDPDQSLTGDQVKLAYVVTISEHQLSTNLHVTNASTSEPLEFQALLHTYYRAPAAAVKIQGLNGLTYTDKVKGGAQGTESRTAVDVTQFTDSVYENAPQHITATWPEGGVDIRTIGFKDVVVWNPSSEAGSKIGDMEEGGW